VPATRKLIEEGVQDNSFALVDSKLASIFVLSVVNWFLIWYRPDGGRTRDEIVEAFIAMIERGLTPRKVESPEMRNNRESSGCCAPTKRRKIRCPVGTLPIPD
jgi:hypothetical protein